MFSTRQVMPRIKLRIKKKVDNDFNRAPWWGRMEGGRALARGAWQWSRWMTGSWVVGSGEGGASILEDSWGWRETLKKGNPIWKWGGGSGVKEI